MINRLRMSLALVNSFVTVGHARTIKTKQNILSSLLIKGGNIAISLLLVPLTIKYVSTAQYGIWLTLSSIIGWFSFFDIGFGNGLRNKFAESVAKGEDKLAKSYISTTYAILTIIISIILLLFFCVNPFLNWAKILNAPANMTKELSLLALIVFVFFCLQFVLQLLITVLTANQQPARASLFSFLGSLISLTIIFILTKTTNGNLINLCLAFGLSPIIVLTISSLWLFGHSYKKYAPSIKYVERSLVPDLMTLGVKFFFLQVAGIILYQTNNIIIAQLFGPAQVTSYNVAFRYFSIVPMVMGIITLPFWSAYTEAWVRNDVFWIKRSLKKLKLLWMLLSIITMLMLTLSSFVYKVWVGNQVKVPISISTVLAVYVIINAWTTIFSLFLNGIGKIKLQLYCSMVGMILNIPLAIYLGRTFGIAGILMSTVFLSLINMILEPIQTSKILNNTAKGLWNA